MSNTPRRDVRPRRAAAWRTARRRARSAPSACTGTAAGAASALGFGERRCRLRRRRGVAAARTGDARRGARGASQPEPSASNSFVQEPTIGRPTRPLELAVDRIGQAHAAARVGARTGSVPMHCAHFSGAGRVVDPVRVAVRRVATRRCRCDPDSSTAAGNCTTRTHRSRNRTRACPGLDSRTSSRTAPYSHTALGVAWNAVRIARIGSRARIGPGSGIGIGSRTGIGIGPGPRIGIRIRIRRRRPCQRLRPYPSPRRHPNPRWSQRYRCHVAAMCRAPSRARRHPNPTALHTPPPDSPSAIPAPTRVPRVPP